MLATALHRLSCSTPNSRAFHNVYLQSWPTPQDPPPSTSWSRPPTTTFVSCWKQNPRTAHRSGRHSHFGYAESHDNASQAGTPLPALVGAMSTHLRADTRRCRRSALAAFGATAARRHVRQLRRGAAGAACGPLASNAWAPGTCQRQRARVQRRRGGRGRRQPLRSKAHPWVRGRAPSGLAG